MPKLTKLRRKQKVRHIATIYCIDTGKYVMSRDDRCRECEYKLICVTGVKNEHNI